MSTISDFFENVVLIFNALSEHLQNSGIFELAKGIKTLTGLVK